MKSLQSIILAFIPFICFIIGYTLCNLCMGNKSYPTPELIGLSLHDAITQTSPLHINISLAAEKECSGISAGTILSQKPAPGRLIKSHQSIIVITSKLPQPIVTPQVTKLSKSAACKICKHEKINIKIYEQSASVPTNNIIGQSPAAGQMLSDSKMILYVAHAKPTQYLVPRLIGCSLHEAIQFLEKNELPFEISYQHEKIAKPYPENMTVITQKPKNGSIINIEKKPIFQLAIT